jgi:hypothetical protein
VCCSGRGYRDGHRVTKLKLVHAWGGDTVSQSARLNKFCVGRKPQWGAYLSPLPGTPALPTLQKFMGGWGAVSSFLVKGLFERHDEQKEEERERKREAFRTPGFGSVCRIPNAGVLTNSLPRIWEFSCGLLADDGTGLGHRLERAGREGDTAAGDRLGGRDANSASGRRRRASSLDSMNCQRQHGTSPREKRLGDSSSSASSLSMPDTRCRKCT